MKRRVRVSGNRITRNIGVKIIWEGNDENSL